MKITLKPAQDSNINCNLRYPFPSQFILNLIIIKVVPLSLFLWLTVEMSDVRLKLSKVQSYGIIFVIKGYYIFVLQL